MEDTHVIDERVRVKDGVECHIYAVYDGHGGARVAEFAKVNFLSLLRVYFVVVFFLLL